MSNLLVQDVIEISNASKTSQDDENRSTSENMSKEGGKNSTKVIKKPSSITSRLFQSTAASAAKSQKPPSVGSSIQSRNVTPVLARKFPSRGNTTPVNKVPTCSVGRPFGTEVRSKNSSKWLTASTKKPGVATSSFINQEANASPADWDASAIVSIDEVFNPISDVRVEPKFSTIGPNNDNRKNLRTKNGGQDPLGQRGPLRALQGHGLILGNVKADSFENSLGQKLRGKQTNFSFGENSPDDSTDILVEQTYDTYLMSEMIRANAQKSFEQNSDKINSEVLSAWVALEELRSDLLEQEELNRKLKTLTQLSDNLDIDLSEFRTFLSSENVSSNHLVALSKSLEQSRHHLQIVGPHITAPKDTVDKLQKKIHSNMPKFSGSTRVQENDQLKHLEDNLSGILISFQHCQVLKSKVSELNTECGSLRLSQKQQKLIAESNLGSVQKVLKMPQRPKTKLVEI